MNTIKTQYCSTDYIQSKFACTPAPEKFTLYHESLKGFVAYDLGPRNVQQRSNIKSKSRSRRDTLYKLQNYGLFTLKKFLKNKSKSFATI